MLRKFISIRDPGHEYYYHMFLSGVLSITSGDALVVKSQIEQGDGYPDIIIDNRSSREAVILELKKADGKDISKLKNAAETALEQIRKNRLCCNYVLIISLLTIIIKQTLNSKILLVV